MERVTDQQLRTLLVVQLTCLPKWRRRKAELQTLADIEAAVDVLMDRIFKDMILVRPSMAMNGLQLQAGKFGQTEQWPFDLAPE